MESVLVLTHCDEAGATLSKGSLAAIGAGKQLAGRLGSPLAIGIVDEDSEKLAANLPAPGARWLAVSGEAFAQPRFASDAAACAAICRAAQATIILAPQSSRFARVLAAVAHRMNGRIDTHIASMGGAGGLDATRWHYRQRIEAVIRRGSRPWFLLYDGAADASNAAETAPAHIERVAVELPPPRTTVTGMRSPEQAAAGAQGGSPRLGTIRPDAKLLLVAGAGWTKKQPDGKIHTAEAGDLILRFVQVSGASLGSSKSLVDQSGEGNSVLPFLTHLNQVGQTGATPRHRKGLATCCHGEEPHVVGWRFIGERRAVSLDPNCGWTRGKADVVYIADAFQVLARLNSLLGQSRPL